MAHVTTLNFEAIGEDLRDAKLSLLQLLDINETSFPWTDSETLPRNFLHACRIYHMDHVEVYFARSPTRSLIEYVDSIISPQNELRTLIFLLKAVEAISDPALRTVAQRQIEPLINHYQSYVNIIFHIFLE